MVEVAEREENEGSERGFVWRVQVEEEIGVEGRKVVAGNGLTKATMVATGWMQTERKEEEGGGGDGWQ